MSGGDVSPLRTELFTAPKEQFGLQTSVNVMNIKYKNEYKCQSTQHKHTYANTQ